MVMKILHLSDLHFHRNNKDNKKVIATLDNVKANYPKHYIVVTGDIVDDGHEKQYDNAFSKLKKFKGRIFIVPGNHDFGAVGNFYSRERAKRFDEKLTIPLEQGGTFLAENKPVVNVESEGGDSVMFIGLDTNLETDHPFDFACGEVGEVQLNALDAILTNSQSTEMKKILFFHHHPFMYNNPFMELKDATALARIVFNRIDVLLFGHKHEMRKWENLWGVEYVHASDNSPGKRKAGEITIKNGKITFDYVNI
jgi:3',5'-cyclic AMP phosphodiesterase CpdA